MGGGQNVCSNYRYKIVKLVKVHKLKSGYNARIKYFVVINDKIKMKTKRDNILNRVENKRFPKTTSVYTKIKKSLAKNDKSRNQH